MQKGTLGYSERTVDYIETLSAPELLAWRFLPQPHTPEYKKRVHISHHIAHEQWKAARDLGDQTEVNHFSETLRAIEATIDVQLVTTAIQKYLARSRA